MAVRGIAHALGEVRRALAPVGEDAVLKAVEAFASVFQTALPEKMGLQLYVLALEDTPTEAFKLACRDVLKNHRFKTLPLPAEILKAAEPHAEVMRLWEQRFRQAQTFLPPPERLR